MERLETGLPGLDALGFGGLPKGRTTLSTGTTASALRPLGVTTVMTAERAADVGPYTREPGGV